MIMRNYDLSPLLRQWIGFDTKLVNARRKQRQPELPPYSIEKRR